MAVSRREQEDAIREEIRKLQRLDLAELEADERKRCQACWGASKTARRQRT